MMEKCTIHQIKGSGSILVAISSHIRKKRLIQGVFFCLFTIRTPTNGNYREHIC